MGTTLLAGFKSEIEIYDPDLIVVSLMSGISHSALCLNIEVQKCDNQGLKGSLIHKYFVKWGRVGLLLVLKVCIKVCIS